MKANDCRNFLGVWYIGPDGEDDLRLGGFGKLEAEELPGYVLVAPPNADLPRLRSAMQKIATFGDPRTWAPILLGISERMFLNRHDFDTESAQFIVYAPTAAEAAAARVKILHSYVLTQTHSTPQA